MFKIIKKFLKFGFKSELKIESELLMQRVFDKCLIDKDIEINRRRGGRPWVTVLIGEIKYYILERGTATIYKNNNVLTGEFDIDVKWYCKFCKIASHSEPYPTDCDKKIKQIKLLP